MSRHSFVNFTYPPMENEFSYHMTLLILNVATLDDGCEFVVVEFSSFNWCLLECLSHLK